MPEAHSKFSASASARWMSCAGSMVLSKGKVDKGSQYADEGTAAHTLASWCLTENTDATAYLGRVIAIEDSGREFEVTDDMARDVQVYVDLVREYRGEDGVLMVERQVNYSAAIGVEADQGWGTSDAIIAKGGLLIVADLKFGRGEEVEAADNTQMALYALGALAEFDGIAEFERVLMVISQPRTSHAPREWEISIDELRKIGVQAWDAASRVIEAEEAYPAGDWHERFTAATEKGCRWCKAKATCPTARANVTSTVFDVVPASPDDFDDMTALPTDGTAAAIITDRHMVDADFTEEQWLGAVLPKIDQIEDWCKAVRAEAETRLLAGADVPGYKLVQGKKGNRAWSDAEQAEQMLKTFRLKQEEMYEFKLISPTTAQKLADAETIGKRQWPKLQALITQSEGQLHVAPVSDKRPAVEVKPIADEFEVVTTAVDDLA